MAGLSLLSLATLPLVLIVAIFLIRQLPSGFASLGVWLSQMRRSTNIEQPSRSEGTPTMSPAWRSPDGRRIASGSGDKTIKVWDAATGEETLTLRGHANVVTSAPSAQTA